ncbi:MAG: TlpA family protein disulfide reductase [Kouleothrix sp.]|jgi:peroxiredoxin|nr:TlpA family protein disulfide reductase [Kouleothrix sp.]
MIALAHMLGRAHNRAAVAGTALVLAGLLFGCGAGTGPVHQGQAAPVLAITTRAGAPAALQPAAGQSLWLVFWASWCYPCRAEWPGLNQAQHDLADRGVRLVAISVNEPASALEQFLTEHAAAFEIARDPEGQAAARYGVVGFPTHVLIDGTGIVRAVVRGPLDGARARALLQLGTPGLAH